MKKFFSLFLVVCLMATLFPSAVIVQADEVGIIGESADYTLTDYNATVVITGTGPMYDYQTGDMGQSPLSYRDDFLTVIISGDVTRVGAGAFRNSNMERVIVGEKVTSIGNGAFGYCTLLQEVSLREGLQTIEGAAFSNCSSLTSVRIPSTVTTIEGAVFRNCSLLTEINIPRGVTSIDSQTFYNCRALEEISLPGGITRIGSQAFMDCEALEEISIPESVTDIGERAFNNCYNLSSITLPYEMERIVRSAFAGTAIREINIPNGIETLESNLFSECSSLETITIPKSVTSIGARAFNGCASLKTVNFEGTEEEWDAITISSGNDYFKGASVNFVEDTVPPTPTEEPTEAPTPIPTEPPTEEPIPTVVIEAPSVSVESGMVPYGTVVDIYPAPGAHFSYRLNKDEEWIPEFLNASITIYEDTILEVHSWCDVIDPNVHYEYGSAIYTYTVDPATIPTEVPTEAPTPTPIPTVVIEAPSVNIASSMVPYGTAVHISSAYGAHFSYRVNGGEWISQFFTATIFIYEDTTLEVESWCDVIDPNVNYEYGSATYNYTVDPSTFPTPIPTAGPDAPGGGFHPSNTKPLGTGTANTISVAEGAEDLFYRFVPGDDGVYRFYTQGNNDPKAVLYDSEGNILATNDNVSADDLNFSISKELSGGETYYINISLSVQSNQDSFYFYVEREDGATEAPTETPTEEPIGVNGMISGNTLSVTPQNIPAGSRVSYAAYLGNQMVGFGSFIYEDLGEDFILPDEYDYIKLFVWDGMTPIINPKEL